MNYETFTSKNLLNVIPSASMNISEKVKEIKKRGNDIIDLSIGEPNFETPVYIKEAAINALKNNKTHYTQSSGIPELRLAIADKLRRENGLDFNPDNEIIVIPGAKQAIFYALAAILNPGEEVLIPEPYWLSYPDMVRLIGARPIGIPSREENSFKPEVQDLEKLVSPKTKILIVNNPNNPTGLVWEKEDLQLIASLAEKYNFLIISDEIYEKIVFDGKKFTSLGNLTEAKERTITVNGFSKAYAMTGWRIAYVAGPAKIISQISRVHQHVATCASSLSQYAALSALSGPQDEVASMVKEYQERRDILLEGFKKFKKIHFVRPAGTFYAFLNVKKLGKTSLEIARLFLEELGIATVPGSAYGASGEGYLRLSFAVSKHDIIKAVQRLEKHFSGGG